MTIHDDLLARLDACVAHVMNDDGVIIGTDPNPLTRDAAAAIRLQQASTLRLAGKVVRLERALRSVGMAWLHEITVGKPHPDRERIIELFAQVLHHDGDPSILEDRR